MSCKIVTDLRQECAFSYFRDELQVRDRSVVIRVFLIKLWFLAYKQSFVNRKRDFERNCFLVGSQCSECNIGVILWLLAENF